MLQLGLWFLLQPIRRQVTIEKTRCVLNAVKNRKMMQNVYLVNKQKDCNWDPGSMNADDLQYAVEWDRIQMKEQSNRIITRNLACRVKRLRIPALISESVPISVGADFPEKQQCRTLSELLVPERLISVFVKLRGYWWFLAYILLLLVYNFSLAANTEASNDRENKMCSKRRQKP